MADNIFLFTGEERYLLLQTLKKRKDGFAQKFGKENIFIFKSDEIEPTNIVNAIFGGGLFDSKKFIVIYGMPKDTSKDNEILESKYRQLEDKLMETFDNISKENIIVFVSFTPDKRTKGYKFFSTKSTIKQFDRLEPAKLKAFIKDGLSGLIADDDIEYLISKVGNDLFSISNEINKLKLFCEENSLKIDKKMIDLVVYDQSKINSFDVLDKMYFDKDATLRLISSLKDEGADEFQFLGMLYWGLKIQLQLIDFYKMGEKSGKDLASKMGVHPFVILKNLKIMDKLIKKESSIKEFFSRLIKLDSQIKNGIIPAELFWLEIKKIVILNK